MKYFHYIEKIKALNYPESDNSVLEILITKINSNDHNIEFQIEELFQNSNENEEIILNPGILKKIEEQLKLNFIYEEEAGTNVCFANSDELRSEFRQSFKKIDLLDYLFAFLHSQVCRQSTNIMIASETELFWTLTKIGTVFKRDVIKKGFIHFIISAGFIDALD